MPINILPFKELSKDSIDIAGGKGASLGEMANNNFPIPPGFVILAAAFEKFLADSDINIEINSALSKVNPKDVESVDSTAQIIQSLIKNCEIDGELKKEIYANFIKLDAKYIAVRSSATAEDSKIDSWAGELESYLYTTKETLLENIKKCWASLFTPRAIFYRFERDLYKSNVSVAVVVQKMVESEISGVAFSVHPITKDYNQMIIEAGWGLGEAIVLGKITPDSYVVSKKDNNIIDINISEQDKMIVKLDDSGGVKEIDVPEEIKNKQKLSEEEIIKLAKIVKNIEKHYASPQDVEWAYKKGEFYIVQARPITTL